jgi:hypothetical protein
VLSAPLLLLAWGPARFGAYAAALGTTLVLNPLVGSGAEKSALLLVPRAVRGGRRLLGAHVTVSLAAAGGSLAVAVAVALSDRGGAVLLLAAATNVGLGVVQAFAAFARVVGRPLADAGTYAALATVVLAGVLGAQAGLGPVGYLAAQAVATVAAAGVLAALLRPRPVRPGRRLLRLAARTSTLMGANTLLATAAVSLVFAVLAGRGEDAAAGHLYVALAGYTVLGNLVDYLQRVYQPRLSTALARAPGRLLGAARAGTRAALLACPLAAAVLLLAASRLPGLPGALAAVAAVAPALAGVAVLTWLLENLDAASLRATTAAAAAGLAATAATALVAVPALGAPGALLALLAGAGIQGAALYPLLARRAAAPARRTPTALTPGRPA